MLSALSPSALPPVSPRALPPSLSRTTDRTPPRADRTPQGHRLRPGTSYQAAYETDPFSPIRPLESFTSAAAVQEYLAALVRRDPHEVEVLIKVPMQPGEEEGEDEEGRTAAVPAVEEGVWLRIVQDQHLWIATLISDCSVTTCPEMQAGPDWYFLCAAHSVEPTPPCCAIDYIVHTSEGAQALLTSPRYFPSRLSISESSRRLLGTVARRVYRSFAHAYYHHHDLFLELESQTSLVRRFDALSRRFGLIPSDMLIILVEAIAAADGEEGEGTVRGEGDEGEGSAEAEQVEASSIRAVDSP